ncbi:hypothetical protein K469DRAFT_750211 [Zopfia rhizophila CBS 207.26]|uniref:Uncharacterized protein n=1 Tax=Zopfia rhizophila CBS 207.26 TaxID=1314779 RepID=A0A6A6E2D8_9PEZI|nr:hypothetical protein K469DRAFT_750211 [Zopfia rhizophila CBS 207.26]
MATTGDPEAQKYDATQTLQVVECQNNTIQNPDVDAAQTDADEEEPVGGVMDAASRMEEQKSTNKERRKESKRAKQDLITSVLLSILLPVYLGLYSVLSIQYTAASNDQSQVANQIALLALCYSNSSSNFCADLLAQTDLYLPKIANNLYGLEPTSGNGKSQPIARLTPESAANITYTVFLKDSSSGTARFKFPQYTFIAVAGLVTLYGFIVVISKSWELKRKIQRVGSELNETC